MVRLTKLLEVNNLRTCFQAAGQVFPAVDDVSFHINKGETLCIVGESGCGKSVTALSIMGLVPAPPCRSVSGEILFNGEDLLKKSESQMRDIRGNAISMIYQEPMTSLNPVFTIGMQIMEPLRLHRKMPKKDARDAAIRMLSLAGMSNPERVIEAYPHQLSGGMRQRVMIAMGLCCMPALLIADEPTTALDVTIQAQILDLMRKLKTELSMTILFISHDLGVVAEMADRVIVMYGGKIAEEGPLANIFAKPLHPYTIGLLSCVPKLKEERGALNVIRGIVPSPSDFPPGCRFHPRCVYAQDICLREEPALRQIGHSKAACHLVETGAFNGREVFTHAK